METSLRSKIWWNDLSDEEFQATFRMSRETFISLQAEIDSIEEQFKESVNRNLLAAVWVLGDTGPLEEAKKLFSIKENVYKTLELYFHKILKIAPNYIVWPNEEESKRIENEFAKRYGFPDVVGVIGSIHINVNAEKCAENDTYYNLQTKAHSIVLQIVCDNNLLLRDVCAGCPGGRSVSSILECSPLYHVLSDKDSYMVKNNKHILGGTQHPLLPTLLTPYKLNNDEDIERNKVDFNMLHSPVLDIIEKTLGYLDNRFPRLTAVDNLSPQFATLIISSICVLHNFTRIKGDNCELYT